MKTMTCLCGYSGEDFIELAEIERNGNRVAIWTLASTPYGQIASTQVSMFACPSCKTVKIAYN